MNVNIYKLYQNLVIIFTKIRSLINLHKLKYAYKWRGFMSNDTTVNSTVINDLDNSFVTIQVTGLRQNKNLRRGFCTFKVSHQNMGETMRRINRMGGKIVDVTFTSQYESQSKEVETNFVAPELAINDYVQPEKITQEDQENKVISTPIHTDKIEPIETVKEENTEIETKIEVTTEIEIEVETQPEVETKIEVKTEVKTEVETQPEITEEKTPEKPEIETNLKEESPEIKASDEKGKKAPIHGHKKGWKKRK